MKALGLIEVEGYLTAIIASDAALKAANVTLIGIEAVKSGISCVKLTGDVDAVKASVEAGEKAARDNGLLRRAHVIPRLHEDTARLLTDEVFPNTNIEPEINADKNPNENPEAVIDNNLSQPEEIKTDTIEMIQLIDKSSKKVNYQNMKVDQLRNYVRKLKINNLTNKQIKLMKKVQLINMLDEYFKENEEGE